MSICIGIISYMPDDWDKRKVRLKQHQEQLAWLDRVLPEKPMLVVAQKYHDYEVEDCQRLYPHTVIRHEEGIGPARARDELLKVFYKSDYDHLLILDDDATVYPYYCCEDIFKEIDENPDKFAKIDAFCTQHPRYLPFKERIYQDKRNLTDWKFTRRPPNTGAQIAVLRNIKKYKDIEVYHQAGVMDALKEGETDFSQLASEDVAFHLDWIRQGLNYYTLEVLQLKESTVHSTIFSEKTEERVQQEKILIENFVKRNQEYGLEIRNGKINWRKVFGYIDKTLSVYYVSRISPLEGFAENLIPKKMLQREKDKRRLF